MKCSNSISNFLLYGSFTSIRNCSTKVSGKGRSKKGLICQPPLSQVEVDNMKNIVGLHIGSNYLSWTSINIEQNEISEMGIASFPENFEKMNLCGLSSFASQSFQMLPKMKYYITEEALKVVSGTAGRHQLLFQSSKMQYVAMLVALLNFKADADEKHENRVLFLKHKLAARLFGLLVGTEVVSSTKMVNDFFNGNTPPRFTPIKCSANMKSQFFSRSRIEKEVIGYSLMTAVTFLELMVRQNEKCFQFVGISTVISNIKKPKEKAASNVTE